MAREHALDQARVDAEPGMLSVEQSRWNDRRGGSGSVFGSATAGS
jgi:hypothetical protein